MGAWNGSRRWQCLNRHALRVSVKSDRMKCLFTVPFDLTWYAPLLTTVREYNVVTEVQPDFEIFHGTKKHSLGAWCQRPSTPLCRIEIHKSPLFSCLFFWFYHSYLIFPLLLCFLCFPLSTLSSPFAFPFHWYYEYLYENHLLHCTTKKNQKVQSFERFPSIRVVGGP